MLFNSFSWRAFLGFCTFSMVLSLLIAALFAVPLSMLLSLNIHRSMVAVDQSTVSMLYRRAGFMYHSWSAINYRYAYKADLKSAHQRGKTPGNATPAPRSQGPQALRSAAFAATLWSAGMPEMHRHPLERGCPECTGQERQLSPPQAQW